MEPDRPASSRRRTRPESPTDGRRRLRPRAATVVLAGAIGAGTLLVGCGSPARVEVSAPSGTAGDGLTDGVTVTGTGHVKGTPDTLTVSIGVTTKRSTVDAAVNDNATTTTAVTAALTGAGVDAKDIQTANYSVQPSYTFADNKQIPDGYTVNNTVTVKLHHLESAGSTIDAATGAGGNDVTVQGVSFSLEDNEALLTQARDDAFADAKGKADQLGQLSGRGLGDTLAISETVQPQELQFRAAGAAESNGATTPVSPGQVSTDVTITVRFALG